MSQDLLETRKTEAARWFATLQDRILVAFEALERGGNAPAVLNAANEAAVKRFLDGTLKFCDISRSCGEVLSNHDFQAHPSLSELLRLDQWARQEMERWRA